MCVFSFKVVPPCDPIISCGFSGIHSACCPPPAFTSLLLKASFHYNFKQIADFAGAKKHTTIRQLFIYETYALLSCAGGTREIIYSPPGQKVLISVFKRRQKKKAAGYMNNKKIGLDLLVNEIYGVALLVTGEDEI